jgi:hypothetical protein
MTIDQIAYLILNSLRGGISTNNESISIPIIKGLIKTYRALILRREFEKGNRLTDLAQKVKVNATYSNGFHTSESIPELVRTKSGYAILKLIPPTGARNIPVVSLGKFEYQQYEKYTQDKPIATLDETRLIIKYAEPEADAQFTILGIFENPEEAFDFNNVNSFWRDDKNYYLPDDLAQQVAQAIINAEGKFLASITPNMAFNERPQQTDRSE